jgi:ubiquinone/menaquinone biosynthesis C-methylase UbiE
MKLNSIDNQMLSCANSLVRILKKSYLINTPFCEHIASYSNIYQYVVYCSFVKKLFNKKDIKILDWGGQYGHVTKILSTFFKNVDLYLPISANDYEKKKGFKTFINEFHNLFEIKEVKNGFKHETINLPDKRYDVVISSGVLEHVREEGKNTESDALREVHRVLKKNGKLVIWNLPHKLSFVENINRILGRSVHDFKYTKKQIIKLASDTNFTVEFLDQHEFFHMSIRRFLSFIVGVKFAWLIDYQISKFLFIRNFFQHFTVVFKKL